MQKGSKYGSLLGVHTAVLYYINRKLGGDLLKSEWKINHPELPLCY